MKRKELNSLTSLGIATECCDGEWTSNGQWIPHTRVKPTEWLPFTEKDVDDRIDEWHEDNSNLSLQQYLGLNKKQYIDFLKGELDRCFGYEIKN